MATHPHMLPYRAIVEQERQDQQPRKASSGPSRQDPYAPIRQDPYASIRQDPYAPIRQDPNAPEKPLRNLSTSGIHGRGTQEASVRLCVLDLCASAFMLCVFCRQDGLDMLVLQQMTLLLPLPLEYETQMMLVIPNPPSHFPSPLHLHPPLLIFLPLLEPPSS